ncbi:hypothetical protein [Pseudohalioglobus lutimaris]|uniref:Uncharacterized protein n=1 Tax=Pseudohalioglobus lutimaris TaxID=1737061 RepID=A0A2N5X4P2_9GAMM|nr:hypothetical protein [Pseudohalioglobus lutimaris]PLW69455.1 hypothetical protein C0039_07975 [Pseudohalioglobus lutimaris]
MNPSPEQLEVIKAEVNDFVQNHPSLTASERFFMAHAIEVATYRGVTFTLADAFGVLLDVIGEVNADSTLH